MTEHWIAHVLVCQQSQQIVDLSEVFPRKLFWRKTYKLAEQTGSYKLKPSEKSTVAKHTLNYTSYMAWFLN